MGSGPSRASDSTVRGDSAPTAGDQQHQGSGAAGAWPQGLGAVCDRLLGGRGGGISGAAAKEVPACRRRADQGGWAHGRHVACSLKAMYRGPCHWQARQRSSSKGGGIAAVSCCQGHSCCAQLLKFLGRASSSVCACLLSGYKAILLHRFVLSPSSAEPQHQKVEKTPPNQLVLHHEVLVKGAL